MKWTNKGHEFDEAAKDFKDKRPVYIYGAGAMGEDLFYRLSFCDCVKGFIDNNENIREYLGKPVYRIYEFLEEKKDAIVVVAASGITVQFMENQLRVSGYRDGIDLFNYYGFIRYYLPIYAMYAWNCVYFHSISVTTTFKCNLKCNACLAFVDKNKNPKHMEIEKIKESLDYYFRAVDFTDFMDIAGGEPLLYPHIENLVEYVGKNFRDKLHKIYITTNGTVIPSDNLCELANKYNIDFNIDDYSRSLGKDICKVQIIKEKCERFSVKYHINKVDSWIDLSFGKRDNSHFTDKQLEKYFISCQQEWPELFESKIYYCDYSTYAARAGVFDLHEEESYDLKLHTDEKRMELFEYGRGYSEKGYVEMCKHCGGYLGANTCQTQVARQV